MGHFDVRRALIEQLALRRRCVNRRPFIEHELFLLVDLLAGVASSCDTGKTLVRNPSASPFGYRCVQASFLSGGGLGHGNFQGLRCWLCSRCAVLVTCPEEGAMALTG